MNTFNTGINCYLWDCFSWASLARMVKPVDLSEHVLKIYEIPRFTKNQIY